ncbi:aminotransferase class I/II-fold pyridoxal phosphate-dependent enzyme, partial [Butyricicoccus sp. 1XD8-22]
QKKYDWHFDKDQIVYSPGTVHAVNVCVRAFTEPGNGIIIQRPSYPPFATIT